MFDIVLYASSRKSPLPSWSGWQVKSSPLYTEWIELYSRSVSPFTKTDNSVLIVEERKGDQAVLFRTHPESAVYPSISHTGLVETCLWGYSQYVESLSVATMEPSRIEMSQYLRSEMLPFSLQIIFHTTFLQSINDFFVITVSPSSLHNRLTISHLRNEIFRYHLCPASGRLFRVVSWSFWHPDIHPCYAWCCRYDQPNFRTGQKPRLWSEHLLCVGR